MIKVFLVEDEIVIRESIHQMIPWAEYGFEFAGEANDGEMALPMIRKAQPDVLITDVKMPFMDGLTLSRLVKKELPDTKIIIISGYDDFDYARQAISLGVEQYLLKPVSKAAFLEVLESIRQKYEQENAQKICYEKFHNEMQEYEKNSRRDFFENLVSGRCDLQKIYETADELHLDIMAQEYNLVLFEVHSSEDGQMIEDSYSQRIADIQNLIDTLFLNTRDYLLFRHQMFSYAVLVKGDSGTVGELTKQCVAELERIFRSAGDFINWFVCTGKEVERLSQLPESYNEGMRKFVYRYMESNHVYVDKPPLREEVQETEQLNLRGLDTSAVNQDTIRNFLCNALEDEVESFVQRYMQMLGLDALKSKMFRQYILLNIHFCTVSFVQKLGYEKDEIGDDIYEVCNVDADSPEELMGIISNVLRRGIRLREENSKGRYRSVIQKAVQFMEENFSDENLTLNTVASVANVSANHFSAMFSQEMNQTFIEYLTGLRMKQAKELLRCTDKRSGEIALEVGYKDSHYFSFLFKKTQGMTPSEYRNRGEGN